MSSMAITMEKLRRVSKPSTNSWSSLIDILRKNAENNMAVSMKIADTLENWTLKKSNPITVETEAAVNAVTFPQTESPALADNPPSSSKKTNNRPNDPSIKGSACTSHPNSLPFSKGKQDYFIGGFLIEIYCLGKRKILNHVKNIIRPRGRFQIFFSRLVKNNPVVLQWIQLKANAEIPLYDWRKFCRKVGWFIGFPAVQAQGPLYTKSCKALVLKEIMGSKCVIDSYEVDPCEELTVEDINLAIQMLLVLGMLYLLLRIATKDWRPVNMKRGATRVHILRKKKYGFNNERRMSCYSEALINMIKKRQ